uniref:Calponin-homology (CH) domain-containing protein n=1 Tax=Panagrolaimus sp. JU765 TaxID=591449 RepID=A0AC34Q890_9BILA
MANHGPSYGLSRELERKAQARFCIEEAQEVMIWIQDVTKMRFSVDPRNMQTAEEVSDALKDGVVLCNLIHKLVNKTNGMLFRFQENPKMPFHKVSLKKTDASPVMHGLVSDDPH